MPLFDCSIWSWAELATKIQMRCPRVQRSFNRQLFWRSAAGEFYVSVSEPAILHSPPTPPNFYCFVASFIAFTQCLFFAIFLYALSTCKQNHFSTGIFYSLSKLNLKEYWILDQLCCCRASHRKLLIFAHPSFLNFSRSHSIPRNWGNRTVMWTMFVRADTYLMWK